MRGGGREDGEVRIHRKVFDSSQYKSMECSRINNYDFHKWKLIVKVPEQGWRKVIEISANEFAHSINLILPYQNLRSSCEIRINNALRSN